MASSVYDFKVNWGMAIDLDKCTGCGACTVNCQVENNVPPEKDGANKLRVISWMHVYKLTNGKDYPDHDVAYLPRPCLQCGFPSCTSVCPVIATTKDEEGGIVSMIAPRCIGCRYCIAACPYHVRYFNWADPVYPEGMEKALTPFTSTRMRGVVEKCHFCHHRFMSAQQRARAEGVDPLDFPEEWYQPACVEACPTGAMVFGDLKNPKHTVSRLIKNKNAVRLLEKLGTDPQVYYISERKWVRDQMDNHLPGEEGGQGGHHG